MRRGTGVPARRGLLVFALVGQISIGETIATEVNSDGDFFGVCEECVSQLVT